MYQEDINQIGGYMSFEIWEIFLIFFLNLIPIFLIWIYFEKELDKLRLKASRQNHNIEMYTSNENDIIECLENRISFLEKELSTLSTSIRPKSKKLKVLKRSTI